jgi:hypothetical protein
MAAVSTSCKANCKPRGRTWFSEEQKCIHMHTLAELVLHKGSPLTRALRLVFKARARIMQPRPWMCGDA